MTYPDITSDPREMLQAQICDWWLEAQRARPEIGETDAELEDMVAQVRSERFGDDSALEKRAPEFVPLSDGGDRGCRIRPAVDDGLVEAVNPGGDADSTGAMAGGILGAATGVGGLPERSRVFPGYEELIAWGLPLQV